MKINVLISTLDQGIERVKRVIECELSYVHYTIIHQISDEKFRVKSDTFENRSDITLITSNELGIAKSRNIGIRNAVGDIAILADDDVEYKEEFFEIIRNTYETNRNVDVACFKIQTKLNEPSYKAYEETKGVITNPFNRYLSSIEITFKIKIIQESNLYFDEHFGLGSQYYPYGEETVFIQDCLEEKLNIWYFPCHIVIHPYISSGKEKSRFDRSRMICEGAIYGRTMGLKSYFYSLKIAMFQARACFRNKTNPIYYLINLINGCVDGNRLKKIRSK